MAGRTIVLLCQPWKVAMLWRIHLHALHLCWLCTIGEKQAVPVDDEWIWHILMPVQGIRMSSFLETNTGPGQRTLSAFLKKIGADSATKPAPPQQHGWNQTFLDRETRQALDKQMQQHRLKQESEQQSMNPSPVMGAVSNGHATDATVLAPAACRACEETDVDPKPPDSHADQLGPGKLSFSAAGCSQKSVLQIKNALEPCQAPEAGSSQPLELTLRDWQPGAASQLARSQDASSDPQQHFQQGPQSDLSLLGGHNSRSGPEQQQEIGHSFPGDLTSCRDVLDTADDAGEPDLVHAWDEEPAGIGEMPEEAHQSGSQGAAAKATPGARTWACQVSLLGCMSYSRLQFSVVGTLQAKGDLWSLSSSILESISHNVTDRQRCGVSLNENRM